jgi:hypothetical protein
MNERAQELATKAEAVLAMLDAIERDCGPERGEWDRAKSELRAAIQAVRENASGSAS